MNIYIYIYTNLLSTSIHGYQGKKRNNPPGTRDKNFSNHCPGEKKKYHKTKRKKRPTPSHQLKKSKRYAVSRSKEKKKPTVIAAMLQLQECSIRSRANYKINLNHESEISY